MQVKDHLSATPLHIEEQLIARAVNGSSFCHLAGLENHFRDDFSVLFCQIIDASDVSLRHDEKMNRGMGVDVFKHHKGFILVKEIGWLFTANDLAEGAILFHSLAEAPNHKHQITNKYQWSNF